MRVRQEGGRSFQIPVSLRITEGRVGGWSFQIPVSLRITEGRVGGWLSIESRALSPQSVDLGPEKMHFCMFSVILLLPILDPCSL
jgi:hypothetical protein